MECDEKGGDLRKEKYAMVVKDIERKNVHIIGSH